MALSDLPSGNKLLDKWQSEIDNEKTYSGILFLSIPKTLHKKLALTAENEGVKFDKLVTCVLTCGLNSFLLMNDE